eukprot:11705756-Heterocapsa_arctica.AAC.1
MQKYCSKDFVLMFDDFESAAARVGGKILLSKLMILKKERPDGTFKKRVLLDCKSSGVSSVSTNSERSFLPRVLDAVWDGLELQAGAANAGSDGCLEFVVLDISDAFWNIPICPDERPWFACRLRGK